MATATSYRGITITKVEQQANVWAIKLSNKLYTGSLAAVKKSIDWWIDGSTIVRPEDLEIKATATKTTSTQTLNYNGATVMNDTGKENDWYIMYQGKIITSKLDKIKEFLDKRAAMEKKAIAKANARKG